MRFGRDRGLPNARGVGGVCKTWVCIRTVQRAGTGPAAVGGRRQLMAARQQGVGSALAVVLIFGRCARSLAHAAAAANGVPCYMSVAATAAGCRLAGVAWLLHGMQRLASSVCWSFGWRDAWRVTPQILGHSLCLQRCAPLDAGAQGVRAWWGFVELDRVRARQPSSAWN